MSGCAGVPACKKNEQIYKLVIKVQLQSSPYYSRAIPVLFPYNKAAKEQRKSSERHLPLFPQRYAAYAVRLIQDL